MKRKAIPPGEQEESFTPLDKSRVWRRLNFKDREEAMESAHSEEDWRNCFRQLGPALLLFARRWTNCRAEAEDIVQEAFVRFWRRQHSIENRALLYAAVRSAALDRLRSEQRRIRRETAVALEGGTQLEPQFTTLDEGQQMLAAFPNAQGRLLAVVRVLRHAQDVVVVAFGSGGHALQLLIQ